MKFRALLLSFLALTISGLLLSGCGVTALDLATGSGDPGLAPRISGVLHGGPNPVIGARVVIYATTSGGYGATASALQEATAIAGHSAHYDTDTNGSFSFAGGYTCPSGQFAYIVAYGGNTGANTNNSNNVMMAALGRCDDLYTNTTYTGNTIWIDELTTVAAGYALGNFITVAGDAVNGYTVNIGAPATNNAGQQPSGSATSSNTLLTGCVANAYYGPGCVTTAAAGLRHAFATAVSLVSTSTGAANATNGNGGVVPVQLLNLLGNILQACVNSSGGGTNATTGAPTTTNSSATGTVYDGTTCGRLFAMTSYTSDGTPGGTLTVAGNTLDAVKNLAHRPAGNTNGTNASFYSTPCSSSTGFNANLAQTCANGTNGTNAGPFYTSSCASGSNSSGSAGNTTAVNCLFLLSSAFSFYQPTLASAPQDFTLAVTYPKGSFSATANAVACNGVTPATNGLLYPFGVATDINDDIVILNEDSGTGYCYNLITIQNNGTPIGAGAYDNNGGTAPKAYALANDSFAHSIVPLYSGSAIKVFTTGQTDTPTVVQTIVSGSNGANAVKAAASPVYVAVDSSGNVFATAQNSASDLGFLTVTQSHSSPSYVGSEAGGTANAGKYFFATADASNNFFSTSLSGPNTALIPAGGATAVTSKGVTGASPGSGPPGYGTLTADNAGNVWTLLNGSTAANGFVINKQTYTPSTGTGLSSATQASISPVQPYTTNMSSGIIDGNNVIWFGETTGASNYVSYIRSYDTVNNYISPQLYGCAPRNSAATVCQYSTTSTSGQVTDFIGVRGMAADAAGNLWVASSYNAQVTEVVGIAAPTWPQFVHNGVSNKP